MRSTITTTEQPYERPPVWLYISIAISAILAITSLSFRVRVESTNKTVGLAVDYDAVESLSAAQGIPMSEAMSKLRSAGVSVVVVPEETLNSLLAKGRALLLPDRLRLVPGEDAGRVLRGLRIRFPAGAFRLQRAGLGAEVLFAGLSADIVRGAAIGLDPTAVRVLSAAGMGIIGRYSNPQGISSNGVRQTIEWAHEQRVGYLLPQGDQVLGRKDSLAALIDALKQEGIYYASPEFTKLAGDPNVVAAIPDLTVRLHSAQAIELDRMPTAEAVERYSKAARERNQRLLLLRPLSYAADRPLDALVAFVTEVNRAVRQEGLSIGVPVPFRDSGVPAWLFALLALSIAPPAYWAGAMIVLDSRLRLLGALVVAGIVVAGIRPSGRPLLALLAATCFPVVAFMVLDRVRPKTWFVGYGLVSAISLVGGLCLAGLLNGLPYFVRAEEFMGVKFAHFVPVLAVFGLFFWRYGGGKESLKAGIRWGDSLLALGALAVLMLIISRTGNDNPAAVSSIELRFRAILDVLLYVRPRSKEFMLGHPAMVLGLGMYCGAMAGRKPYVQRPMLFISLLAVGALGQTSMVNTMAHLHTPVLLSLARIGVGWVAGGILGLVLWTFFDRRATRKEEA